jgi:hypothetical protein
MAFVHREPPVNEPVTELRTSLLNCSFDKEIPNAFHHPCDQEQHKSFSVRFSCRTLGVAIAGLISQLSEIAEWFLLLQSCYKIAKTPYDFMAILRKSLSFLRIRRKKQFWEA